MGNKANTFRPVSRVRWVACLLLTAGTVASCFYCIAYGDGDYYEIRLGGGAIGVEWGELLGWPSKRSFSFGFDHWRLHGFGLLFWPVVGNAGTEHWAYLPFWPLVAAFLAWNVIPWQRARRRMKRGLCRRCGYDLRADVSGRCPECGLQTPSRADVRT